MTSTDAITQLLSEASLSDLFDNRVGFAQRLIDKVHELDDPLSALGPELAAETWAAFKAQVGGLNVDIVWVGEDGALGDQVDEDQRVTFLTAGGGVATGTPGYLPVDYIGFHVSSEFASGFIGSRGDVEDDPDGATGLRIIDRDKLIADTAGALVEAANARALALWNDGASTGRVHLAIGQLDTRVGADPIGFGQHYLGKVGISGWTDPPPKPAPLSSAVLDAVPRIYGPLAIDVQVVSADDTVELDELADGSMAWVRDLGARPVVVTKRFQPERDRLPFKVPLTPSQHRFDEKLTSGAAAQVTLSFHRMIDQLKADFGDRPFQVKVAVWPAQFDIEHDDALGEVLVGHVPFALVAHLA